MVCVSVCCSFEIEKNCLISGWESHHHSPCPSDIAVSQMHWVSNHHLLLICAPTLSLYLYTEERKHGVLSSVSVKTSAFCSDSWARHARMPLRMK